MYRSQRSDLRIDMIIKLLLTTDEVSGLPESPWGCGHDLDSRMLMGTQIVGRI